MIELILKEFSIKKWKFWVSADEACTHGWLYGNTPALLMKAFLQFGELVPLFRFFFIIEKLKDFLVKKKGLKSTIRELENKINGFNNKAEANKVVWKFVMFYKGSCENN